MTAPAHEPLKPAALKPPQAALYIGMSLSWLEHSDVPRVKMGRSVVYRVVDLDSYLAARCDLDAA
jgi:hypothetical protein